MSLPERRSRRSDFLSLSSAHEDLFIGDTSLPNYPGSWHFLCGAVRACAFARELMDCRHIEGVTSQAELLTANETMDRKQKPTLFLLNLLKSEES